MSGEKCQCKTPQINHIDVKKIHGSTCVTCGKIILYPEPKMPDSKVEVKACPECLGILKYRESSFEQYQPSVYFCGQCDKEFDMDFVRGFNKGLESRPIANNGVSLEDIVDILEDVRTKSEKHWHGAYTALSIDQGKAIIAKLQPTAPRGAGEERS